MRDLQITHSIIIDLNRAVLVLDGSDIPMEHINDNPIGFSTLWDLDKEKRKDSLPVEYITTGHIDRISGEAYIETIVRNKKKNEESHWSDEVVCKATLLTQVDNIKSLALILTLAGVMWVCASWIVLWDSTWRAAVEPTRMHIYSAVMTQRSQCLAIILALARE